MWFLRSVLSIVLLVPIFASVQQSCPSDWTASTSVPGKCYQVLSGFDASSTYYDLVFGCVRAGNGAGDILAIANDVEDAELAQLLSENGLGHGAIVGLGKANGQPFWLAQAGFTSYLPTIVDTGYFYSPFSWLDTQGTINLYNGEADYVPNSLICQLYLGNSSYARDYVNCPDGFVQSVTVPGKCYYFNDGDLPTKLDFADATAFCTQQGAELLQLRGGYPEVVEAYWAVGSPLNSIPWLNYVKGNDSTWQWLGSNPPPANFSLDLDDSGENGACSVIADYVDPTAVDCGSTYDPSGYKLVPLCELYPGGSPSTFPTVPTGPPTGTPTAAGSGTAPSCPCQIGSVWLDIVFVIDVTAGVDRSGVQSIENTIDTVLLQLTVAQSGSYSSRVAIITAGDNATVVANLKVYNDSMSAVLAINQVLRTVSTQSAAPNIADGLDAARKLLDASDRYGTGYGQVVVVMSSKQSECSGDHRSEPECVNAAGILDDAQRSLVTIALKPARATDLPRVDLGNPDCTILNGSDPTLPDLIAQAFCNANCFCPFEDYKQVQYVNGSTCTSYATCVFMSSAVASSIAAPLACTGSLVQIQDANMQAFLNNFDSPANQDQQQYYPYWFGLSGVPPNFVWADGTPLGPNDYSNWQVVPTPGGAKQCAYVKPFGLNNTPKWFTSNCSASAPYDYTICQLPSCSSTDNSCLTTADGLKGERRQKTAL